MSPLLRDLPSVNEVLAAVPLVGADSSHAHERIVEAVRLELDFVRNQLKNGSELPAPLTPDLVAQRAALRLAQDFRPRLRPVINATGILLHTNLGRAPMAEEAAQAAFEAARGYLNLEMDLETGKRSSRQNPVREWLTRLTGAESATAVNNCAAATVITLRAVCAGKEAIVSRGQLIEIGGSFRIPEIMAVSGAALREVGTTNITRSSDYERAITPQTGALMRVHTSNYRVSGFTHAATLEELVLLGKIYNLPVIDDCGSGALIDFGQFGFEGEPIIPESIKAGADLVLFSGDKLLGGPQAGLIVGKKEWIQKIEKDPLMRAFRLDKMTLAALEATLRLYLNMDKAKEQIPELRLLGASLDSFRHRAEALARQLSTIPGICEVQVEEEEAFVGGGSLPDQVLKTVVICLGLSALSDEEMARRLRCGAPAVVGRLKEGKLVLDLRTIFTRDEEALIGAIKRALE